MKFHSFAFNPWTHEAMGAAVQRQVFCRAPVSRGRIFLTLRINTQKVAPCLGPDAHPRQKRSKAPPRRSFTSRATSAVVGSQPARDRLPYLSVSAVEMTSRKWVHL